MDSRQLQARDYARTAAEHREMAKTCRVLGERRKADYHDAEADKYASMAVI